LNQNLRERESEAVLGCSWLPFPAGYYRFQFCQLDLNEHEKIDFQAGVRQNHG
jgi:hypothetical protein